MSPIWPRIRDATERIALVVGGEPGKAPHVIDAIAPWLTDRGHTPVLDALDDAATGRLVACFLDDDDACAADVVRAAAGPATLDRLLFVMVDLEQVVAGAATVDNVTLTGLLFDPTGAERRAERRLCEDCRIAALATAATDLAAAALGATAGAADPTAVPVAIASSPAGATISIDGKPAGTTPATVPLAPGRHRVRLALAGHIATERDLDVARRSHHRPRPHPHPTRRRRPPLAPPACLPPRRRRRPPRHRHHPRRHRRGRGHHGRPAANLPR
jgi:hypothetical protein